MAGSVGIVTAIALMQRAPILMSLAHHGTEPRLRCRECDARGKAVVVSIKWGEPAA
jgi:hypothetical protein